MGREKNNTTGSVSFLFQILPSKLFKLLSSVYYMYTSEIADQIDENWGDNHPEANFLVNWIRVRINVYSICSDPDPWFLWIRSENLFTNATGYGPTHLSQGVGSYLNGIRSNLKTNTKATNLLFSISRVKWMRPVLFYWKLSNDFFWSICMECIFHGSVVHYLRDFLEQGRVGSAELHQSCR